MSSDVEITSTINAHHLTNPPAERRGSFINFTFANLSHLQVKDLSDDSQTVLEITIPNPRQMFFKGSDDNELDREIKNLLLSINFTLKRGCVTKAKLSFTMNRINPKSNPDSSTSRVIKMDVGAQVLMNESISIRDSTSTEITGNETFDENEVLKIFKKIQDFDSANSSNISNNAIIQHADIEKALYEYTQAMESIDRLSKFKHLYNSLELIVNSDGQNRRGMLFDNEVNNLANVPVDKVAVWHEFYNRSKHMSRDNTDIQTFNDGTNDLPNWLQDIKECCTKVILSRL